VSREQLKQLLAKPNLSPKEVLAILEERTLAAQHELASCTDAGADVLDYLAKHGGIATRRAVAANIAAPPAANRLLGEDADDEVRVELARKIARLMPDLSREEMVNLREMTIDLMEKLARDQAPRVRAILADEIKHLTCVPKQVVETLANDMEEIVAAPILEYSPLLSDVDLIEIIAGARADFALGAIARRKSLSPELSDAIIGTLDISAVAALLANPKAAIRDQTLEKLVETAESIDALQAPLVLRSELSERTIRRLAGFVGAGLLDTLSQRRELDEDTSIFLQRQLRLRLGESKTSTPFPAEKPPCVTSPDFMQDMDYIGDAIRSGRRGTVFSTLASLSKVPLATVHRIFEARSARAVIALVWKAGLPMRVAFQIQSSVMKLPAAEIIPARNGKDFPLTKDEMCWQLRYFGVTDSACSKAGTSP
jgi:uncharacterized protein (DUF2336 family)